MSKYNKMAILEKLEARGIKILHVQGVAVVPASARCGLKCLAWLDFLGLVPMFK